MNRNTTMRMLTLAGAAGALSLMASASPNPCPDLNGDGIVGSAELNVILGSFGDAVDCPPPAPQCAVVKDIRAGIQDADLDPPHVQRNYDAINRTVHLFGDLTMQDFFLLPIGVVLDHAAQRAGDLGSACGPQTDVAGLMGAIDNAKEVALELNMLELVSAPPGVLVDERAAMDVIRTFGVGLPPFPMTEDQAASLGFAAQILVQQAPWFTYDDFYNLPAFRLAPPEAAAVENAKQFGVLKFKATDVDNVQFGVCSNDRCYKTQSSTNLDKCFTNSGTFCKIRKVDQQPDGSGLALAGSDKCP